MSISPPAWSRASLLLSTGSFKFQMGTWISPAAWTASAAKLTPSDLSCTDGPFAVCSSFYRSTSGRCWDRSEDTSWSRCRIQCANGWPIRSSYLIPLTCRSCTRASSTLFANICWSARPSARTWILSHTYRDSWTQIHWGDSWPSLICGLTRTALCRGDNHWTWSSRPGDITYRTCLRTLHSSLCLPPRSCISDTRTLE